MTVGPDFGAEPRGVILSEVKDLVAILAASVCQRSAVSYELWWLLWRSALRDRRAGRGIHRAGFCAPLGMTVGPDFGAEPRGVILSEAKDPVAISSAVSNGDRSGLAPPPTRNEARSHPKRRLESLTADS
jgi:hypothetical protein